MAADPRIASCCCGQLRVELYGEPGGVGVCHCRACQQRTGSAFALLVHFGGPYTVRGEVSEHVRRGDGGARFRFRFCPVCGSTVFHTEEDVESDGVSIAVGTLQEPLESKPEVSVYDCRRLPWVNLPQETKRFERDPP